MDVVRSGPVRFATARRFGLPEPPDPGPVTAQECPQPPSRLERVLGPPRDRLAQGEDCLALSVVAPSTPGPHPVMVFVHGGGLSSGSGLRTWYDGGALAAEGDVVVVSAGYRVGPFGWLRLDGVSPGNLGLHDVVAALEWVHAHVAEYGGDPERLTLFGQSAGAAAIGCLLEIPSSRRLFRRAVIQSGPLERITTDADAAAVDGRVFAGHLGADTDPVTASPRALLDAFARTAVDHRERTGSAVDPPMSIIRGVSPLPAEPVVPVDPGSLDVLVGWNRDELTAFGFDPHDVPAASEDLFARPHVHRARTWRTAGVRVRGYRLDWRPEGSPFGATHCLELPLLLGDAGAWAGSPMLGATPWARVERFGRQLRAVWARFARTGEVDPALAPDVPVAWDPTGELAPLLTT